MEIERTEWDAICRICLQEGPLSSIFEYDEENTEMTIANKIMLCSSIDIKSGANLPEQICINCLDDLSHAYRFRLNCERSEAILQSFVDSSIDSADDIDCSIEKIPDENETSSVVVTSDEGAFYEYWPPVGLNVKRVRTDSNKSLLNIQQKYSKNHIQKQKNDIKREQHEPISFIRVERIDENISEDDPDIDIKLTIDDIEPKHSSRLINKKNNSIDADDPDYNPLNDDETTIKPIRVNKARLGFSAANKKSTNLIDKITKKKDTNTTTSTKRTAGEKKIPKTCPICGNTYKFRHALESHMRRHRNEKPFVCSVCGKGFVINFELTRHMRTHTGQKPYACKYCDRRFSDFGSRVKHERTHTGERPYACDVCGKTFTYSHVLSSHMLIHTGEKKYHCELCGKRFTKSHHLKAHMNTHNRPNAKGNLQNKQINNPTTNTKIDKIDDIVATNAESNDNDLTEYIIQQEDMLTEDEDVINGRADEHDSPLLLYSDVGVDVLGETVKPQGIIVKRGKQHFIEDINGIQHEITITDNDDGMELLTFEDDDLE